GLLGAELSRHESGYIRIDRILPGHNWDPKYRSPLTEIGVNVQAGEYIIAIDGFSTADLRAPHEALVGKAGQQVRLRVNDVPSEDGAREVVVVPTDSEQGLHYLDWVLRNIQKVEEATDGQVGYVHVPDMQ